MNRPDVLAGYTRRFPMGCGHVYVTFNFGTNGCLYELFVRLGKSGGCQSCQVQAFGRLTSIAIQDGIGPKKLGKTLIGMQCPEAQAGEVGKVFTSCLDGIGKELVGIGGGSITFVDGDRKPPLDR